MALYTWRKSLSLTPSKKGVSFRIGQYFSRVTWSTEKAGQMMLRFHQHPPEVIALPQIELYEIVADTEARSGPENFDLSKKIVIQPLSLIQVFLEKDTFGYFVVDLLPLIKLVPELRKKRPHIEGGRHRIGTAEINRSKESGRWLAGILSDENILGMEISMPLYQPPGVSAVIGRFELEDHIHDLLRLPGKTMTVTVKGREILVETAPLVQKERIGRDNLQPAVVKSSQPLCGHFEMISGFPRV
jgi:hypothetical protein